VGAAAPSSVTISSTSLRRCRAETSSTELAKKRVSIRRALFFK
jgi:hypothetical protein